MCPGLRAEVLLGYRADAYNNHVIGRLNRSPNELGDRLSWFSKDFLEGGGYIAHSASPTGNLILSMKKELKNLYSYYRNSQQFDNVNEVTGVQADV